MLKSKSAVGTVLILFVALFVYHHNSLTEAPTLAIENGKIKGVILHSRQGKTFAAYRGIPYATPPEGDLRFQPPQPALNWNGTHDASNYGPRCAQYNLIVREYDGVENCLFVDVFTPTLVNSDQQNVATQLLPVLVYIHGGYFQLGGPSLHDPAYVMDTNIVLVTIAYRLGAFGFLSTGDDEVPGNMGLKDQHLALTWVKKNIRNFGGDQDRVTISGTSAGSASVHFQVLSKQSKGLFRRAISSSGTGLGPWAINNKPKEQAQRLAERLNCPTETSKEMIDCLRNKSAEEIGYSSEDSAYPTRSRIDLFVPVVEPEGKNRFLSTPPVEILKSGQHNRVPWLSGVMASEGVFFAISLKTNDTFRNIMQTQWDEQAAKVVYLEDPEMARRVRSQYVGRDEKSANVDLLQEFDKYVDIVSDSMFNFPLQASARLQSQFSPVYLYYFNYTTDYSFVALMAAIRAKWPVKLELLMSGFEHIIHRKILGTYSPFRAISHGDEVPLQYCLPLPGLWIGKGHPDYEMSLDFVQTITDFASVEDLRSFSFRNVSWPAVDSEEPQIQKFMEINERPSMIAPPFAERLKFWNLHYKY